MLLLLHTSRMAEAQQQKLQTDSPTGEQDPAQPVDPTKEAIDAALNPEKSGENSAQSGSKATDAQMKAAMAILRSKAQTLLHQSATGFSQSDRSARDIPSLISSFA